MRALRTFALRREHAILRTLFFLAPFLTLIAPKLCVTILVLLFIGCLGLSMVYGQRLKQLVWPDLQVALLTVAALYLFINATWSFDPSRAVGKAVFFTLVAVLSVLLWRALAQWQAAQLRVAATAFLLGLTAGVALVLFEAATGRLLTISAYNILPFTRPESVKAMTVKDGEVIRIAAFELNRNVTVMLMTLWPAMLCVMVRARRWRFVCAGGLFLAVLAAIFLSTHESSKLGIVASAMVFVLARASTAWVRRALAAIWALAFLLVVPLATLAYKAELHEAQWLQYSAKARISLWGYTAEQVPNAPIFGIGGSSTRKMDLDPETRLQAIEAKAKGEDYEWRAGPHAHNAFLQTWYELGGVGALLFLAAGVGVILSSAQITQPTQPYVLAHFAAFMVIVAFGWGMWQSWLIALAGLATLYAALAVNLFRAEKPSSQPI